MASAIGAAGGAQYGAAQVVLNFFDELRRIVSK
jgi:hypothetical protein